MRSNYDAVAPDAHASDVGAFIVCSHFVSSAEILLSHQHQLLVCLFTCEHRLARSVRRSISCTFCLSDRSLATSPPQTCLYVSLRTVGS